MIGDSISIFASIGRLPIELWLLLCCLKQPPIIDSSTEFENRPFLDKKLAQVLTLYTAFQRDVEMRTTFSPPKTRKMCNDSPIPPVASCHLSHHLLTF